VVVELQHDAVELLGASAMTVVVPAAESNGWRALLSGGRLKRVVQGEERHGAAEPGHAGGSSARPL
jgi:hypothetical protein